MSTVTTPAATTPAGAPPLPSREGETARARHSAPRMSRNGALLTIAGTGICPVTPGAPLLGSSAGLRDHAGARTGLGRRQRVLLLAPLVLVPTMYAAFQIFTASLGLRTGVVAAFGLYWAVWCFGLPLVLLGWWETLGLFRPGRSRFGRPAWLWATLLTVPVLGGVAVKTLPVLSDLTPLVVLVSLAFVFPNAVGEELLWRGAFQRLFPGRIVLGWLYPAVMFVLWHLAPTSVLGGAAGVLGGSALIGLLHGWVVRQTGSLRWVTVFHLLTDLSGMIGLFLLGMR